MDGSSNSDNTTGGTTLQGQKKPRKPRSKKAKPELIQYLKLGDIEVGIDEAGRGCLAGPVQVAAVVWLKKESDEDRVKYDIRDSKKLSRKNRKLSYEYIKSNAIAYSIKSGSHEMVDKYNILETTKRIMHECVKDIEEQLKSHIPALTIDKILVDGTQFDTYFDDDFECVPHQCVISGDNIYKSIAAASILAKETRDQYMEKLVADNPEYEKYGWKKNMAYGTKQHIDAIKEHGITPYHRRTFGLCKNY
jgi:ribonuclease HII